MRPPAQPTQGCLPQGKHLDSLVPRALRHKHHDANSTDASPVHPTTQGHSALKVLTLQHPIVALLSSCHLGSALPDSSGSSEPPSAAFDPPLTGREWFNPPSIVQRCPGKGRLKEVDFTRPYLIFEDIRTFRRAGQAPRRGRALEIADRPRAQRCQSLRS